MAKIIKHWDDARKEIYSGIKKISDTVKVTMWPKWRNVILEKSYWAPVVTNDGVTVTKEIELENKLENIWAELVKEAANKTNEAAGDGTTSTVVLVEAIAKEWMRYIRSWVNPFSLGKWLQKSVDFIVSKLQENSQPLNSKEKIKQVASISAQSEEVWTLISDVMEEIGEDWTITVEEWKSIWLEKSIVTGMQFDQWYLSPYFVTDTARMETVIENPYILITDKKISSVEELLPSLEQMANTGKKDVVIIAEDIDWQALTTLVLNKLRWVLNVLAVKAPWFGDRKKEMLKDIAIVSGAEVISEELWFKLDKADLSMFWQASKVIATKDNTTIIEWKWVQENILQRVEEIKSQISASDSEYDREKLQERLARLAWGVAVIKVWAATEMEMKNKKFKIEDALNATRAWIEEWILPWGWTALLKLVNELSELKFGDKDEELWIAIIQAAIQYPAKQIADNAWHKWELIVENIKLNKEFNYGYNSKTAKYGDLIKDWVIDPTKVIRVSLQEAVSAASMLLTTDAVVSDAPKKDEPATPDMWWMGWMWSMGWMWWMPWMM